jgi:hypothetical protein
VLKGGGLKLLILCFSFLSLAVVSQILGSFLGDCDFSVWFLGVWLRFSISLNLIFSIAGVMVIKVLRLR